MYLDQVPGPFNRDVNVKSPPSFPLRSADPRTLRPAVLHSGSDAGSSVCRRTKRRMHPWPVGGTRGRGSGCAGKAEERIQDRNYHEETRLRVSPYVHPPAGVIRFIVRTFKPASSGEFPFPRGCLVSGAPADGKQNKNEVSTRRKQNSSARGIFKFSID